MSKRTNLHCPRCSAPLTEAEVLSLHGKLNAGKRETYAGPAPVPTECRCGKLCPSARAAREHCKGKPRRRRKP